MRELKLIPTRDVERLPGGGDGWWTRATVADGDDQADFNLAVADRAQGPPSLAALAVVLPRLAPDNWRSGLDQLRDRAEAYPGLAHPVVWIAPEYLAELAA